MAYRTCADCAYNDGCCCILGYDGTYENYYDENQCDDGTGNIYLDDDDDDDEWDDGEDDEWDND